MNRPLFLSRDLMQKCCLCGTSRHRGLISPSLTSAHKLTEITVPNNKEKGKLYAELSIDTDHSQNVQNRYHKILIAKDRYEPRLSLFPQE